MSKSHNMLFFFNTNAFNLNNLSRKEVMSSTSLSFFSISKKYDKDLISSSNINDKIIDDQNQESMIIETYKNNILVYIFKMLGGRGGWGVIVFYEYLCMFMNITKYVQKISLTY